MNSWLRIVSNESHIYKEDKEIIIKGVATESVTRNSSSKSENEQSDDYQRNNDNSFCYDEYSNEYDSLGTKERSSVAEHTVKEHGQHYHTKEGIIWKEKESFTRGGKKGE